MRCCGLWVGGWVLDVGRRKKGGWVGGWVGKRTYRATQAFLQSRKNLRTDGREVERGGGWVGGRRSRIVGRELADAAGGEERSFSFSSFSSSSFSSLGVAVERSFKRRG